MVQAINQNGPIIDIPLNILDECRPSIISVVCCQLYGPCRSDDSFKEYRLSINHINSSPPEHNDDKIADENCKWIFVNWIN